MCKERIRAYHPTSRTPKASPTTSTSSLAAVLTYCDSFDPHSLQRYHEYVPSAQLKLLDAQAAESQIAGSGPFVGGAEAHARRALRSQPRVAGGDGVASADANLDRHRNTLLCAPSTSAPPVYRGLPQDQVGPGNFVWLRLKLCETSRYETGHT